MTAAQAYGAPRAAWKEAMTNPINTDQPSIVLNELVVESGTLPNLGGSPTDDPGGVLIGSIRTFATTTTAGKNGVAGDQVPADGQALSLNSQTINIISVIGNTYAGGTTNFDLPNLEGTLMTGAGAGGPTGTLPLGTAYGQNSVTLTLANLPTSVLGSDQSFSNDQPSLAVNYLIDVGGSGSGLDVPGMIVPYLGSIAPAGYMFADGQVLSDLQFPNLYAAIGDTYDGGTSADPGFTFALPNLQGRTIVGAGGAESLGATGGSDTTALTTAELPSPDGSDTGVNNQQPFLALTYIIYTSPTGADLPGTGALGANTPYLGEIMAFAGTAIPQGWTIAAGQTLSVSTNTALFSQIGTTYGGNGVTTFDLPNLESKAVAGTGGSQALGTTFGTNSYTLTSGELAANSAPTITIANPSGNVVVEGSSLDLTTIGMTVADSDSNGGVETLTVKASEGSFQLAAGTTGVALGTDASGNNTISGTISQLNAWLAGNDGSQFQFNDASAQPGSATLTFSLDDNGNSGFPGAQTTSTQLTLAVDTAQAPTITVATTSFRVSVNGEVNLLGAGITVSDPDAGNSKDLSLDIVSQNGNFSGGGSFGGVTESSIAEGIELSGTLAQINALFQSGQGNFYDIEPNTIETLTFTLTIKDAASGLSNSQDITITTPCYCPGTLIKTARGDKRVEKLKIGDQVTTASGALRPIKWIGRRSYAGRFVMGRKDILPVCIKAGALDENVPKRDLWISPHHAMYLDGVLIEAKDLVNGISIVQAERVEKVEYFHIELETHDVIVAEGALSETYLDDDNRSMFHNARDYDALYQDVAAAPAHYCAPRLDEGYELENVRQRLALRAGLSRTADGERIDTLRGYLDEMRPHRVVGWAQTIEHPDAPVCLDIFADGKLIGQVLANRYREDLERAIGSGYHGFEFTSAFDLSACTIEVRRSRDGAAVGRSAKPGVRTAARRLG